MSTSLVRLGEHGTAEIDWPRLLTSDAQSLTPDERYVALSILDAGTKAFASRVDALKVQIRAEALAAGLEEGKSITTERGGAKVQVTRKKSGVAVNEVALLALLSKRGLDPETLCFRRALSLDGARLEQAIAGGVFTDDEVRSFTSDTPAPAPSVSVKGYAMGLTSDKLLGGSK